MRSWLRSDVLRTALAMAAISLWTLLLFSGWSLGGTVHLLLVLALALFPWRWLTLPADTPMEDDP